jgi:hypothetical protein
MIKCENLIKNPELRDDWNIITNGVISKTSQLSFPQVERVGNLSENKERFRTSRNDKPATECGLTYELFIRMA